MDREDRVEQVREADAVRLRRETERGAIAVEGPGRPASTTSSRGSSWRRSITGPIPVMLESALAWARRVLLPVVSGDASGAVRNDTEYPLVAIRELLSNALVHRDLAEWSAGYAIEVRHLPDRFVVTNPGGLFGITVDRLGEEGLTSARNGALLRICQFIEMSGGRVVEALASGIPTIRASLRSVGLPDAVFIDQGIRFTAILRRAPARAPRRQPVSGASATRVWDALAGGGRTVAELREVTGLGEANLQRILRTLRDRGLVVIQGGPGRHTTYRRSGSR